MIIQTGMQTDIPAFYFEWFLNRLREGYVLVRNPYDPRSVTRYNISPDVVDLVAFCTKNPAPMLPHMDVRFMHLLITNDDGISAQGIAVLARTAAPFGNLGGPRPEDSDLNAVIRGYISIGRLHCPVL